MRLIHLTDPHLSSLAGESPLRLRGKRWSGYLSWRKNRSKQYLPAVLKRLVDAVHAEGADQILLTGDLIQIGLDSEIAQASDWLGTLGPASRVMLVPGNHDIYAQGSEASVERAWDDYLFRGDEPGAEMSAASFPTLRKHGGLSFIGVSSACVTPVFMATGRVGKGQLERLGGMLRQAADEGQLVCLLIHHPPLPGMSKWRKALSDAVALKKVLGKHPPALIFHGHLHHNRELQWGHTHIYCTSAASSCCDASYRVIDIEASGDHWDLAMTLKTISIESETEPEFVVVDQQCWELPRQA
jgi:3',5'-cyclic AMP phosphodiesterase CpdA